MAKKTQEVNPIQAKLDALVAERNEVIKTAEQAKTTYDNCQVRLIEINSQINLLVELFSKGENENDSEGEVNESTDTNEK